MNSLPKQKRDQLVMVVIATVGIMAGLYLGLIKAQKRTLESTSLQAAKIAEDIRKAEKTLKGEVQIKEDYAARLSELRKIEDGMASGDMYSWVIRTMNQFLTDHPDVSIPNFSREQLGDAGILPKFPYKAASFQLRGTAHYHDFGAFVAAFENHFPHIRLQNIELTPAGEGERLNVRFELVALTKPTTK